MDTGIALRTILLLFLFLFLPLLSIADITYPPYDHISVDCGSTSNSTTRDGRSWTAENTKLLSDNHQSVAATPLTPSTLENPYTSARLSYSQFNYSFPATTGPKFLRLFFYSTTYPNFDSFKAKFSVKAGKYTLLQDFNASINAEAEHDPSNQDLLLREYCINLKDGEKLNITFTPSTKDSFAFINGIEIVSMPPYLYYTNLSNIDSDGWPKLVGGQPYFIPNNSALETVYRLKVGGQEITPSQDSGMLRRWEADNDFLTSESKVESDYGGQTKLSFILTPNYTAPDEVYRSSRVMGPDQSKNMGFNLTWQLPVDSGFTYLLRLYFCQLNPIVSEARDLRFCIFIADQLATNKADVLLWTENKKGVPVIKDYVVLFNTQNHNKSNLTLKLHPYSESRLKNAQLNAIELLKINNSKGSLAGPDPDSPRQTSVVSSPTSVSKSRNTTRTLAAIAGAVSGALLLSFILAFFLIKRRRNVVVHKGSKQKDGTSRGNGASSLPTNLCRHFSIAEIRAATNNFDELFLVGVGGFGNVYKGYVDDGSTRVAIKRLKPGSQQGVQEFMNEIEVLSQLRHLHLVSLIGYCYESSEMILVYDFMDRGTLRDHLYGSNDPSLSWKQRLQICIGAARGLHYLHTGARHMIIHRDVKSTNILLDEKWVAKVSDFGLSRIGPTSSSMTHVSTQVKGSVGYLDPEYYKRQRLTEKSDVYSFGVVLLEVLSGREPLIRTVEKQRVSLVDWAKKLYEKGSLGEILDPTLKGQMVAECLRKFGEVALSCLLEDGTQRPSMNDVVGMLEFIMQLQDSDVIGVIGSEGDYEDNEDMFSSSDCTVHVPDYSNSTGVNTTSNDSYGSKESHRLIPENVFSEIKDPKGR